MRSSSVAPGSTSPRDPIQTTEADGLPAPRRYWAAAAIWLAMAMAVLDASIANIALPTIAHEFGATPAASIWIVNAYQIALTMLILPVAALGEIFGYRRIYGIGLAFFVVGSVVCTFADGLTSLAYARFAQGLGAAGVMAINGAIVRFTYPKAHLGRGIGYNVLVVSISSAAGPSVAAAILSLGSWRWLFAVNIPLGLLSLVIGQRNLPDTPGTGGRFRIASAVLNALLFGAVFLAADDAALGAFTLRTFVEIVVAATAGVLLVRREWNDANPLVPLDLLRIPILRLSYLASICGFGAQMIGLVSLPFYLQMRFGFDHVQVGLLITAWPLSVAVSAPLAGRLVERVAAGVLGGIGLAVMGLGFVALAVLPVGTPIIGLVVALVACGGGFGLFQAPNNRIMLGTAPSARSGAAGGMLAMARLVGQTSGAVSVAFLFRIAGAGTRDTFALAVVLSVIACVASLRRQRTGRSSG